MMKPKMTTNETKTTMSMNTDTNNEVVNLSPPQEWLYKCDCPKCISGAHYDKEIAESYRKRGELKNEVERLRELLNRAIEAIPDSLLDENGDFYENAEHTKLKAELARIAPAPEEAAPCRHSDDVNCRSCHVGEVKEPVPSWRELGPDEVICEGDEKFVGRGPWLTQAVYIGAKAGEYPLIRFRTRRPLPKQEEMPLEKELKKIEWHQNYSEATIYHALADAIRYLRDEVEKLKYMQDQHTKCLHLTKDEVVKLKEAKP